MVALPSGIRPREEHGQNFLVTSEILRRSCDYAELGPGDTVLEVGPGPGTLTEHLAARAGRVWAVEIDRQFEPFLTRLQERFGNLEVMWGDALVLDLPAFDKLVANLPYKPALPLIMRVLERDFALAVVVVQQRLARRLAARPGQEGYSRISVTVQRVASLRLLEVIKPHHFVPPPAVDSAMLRIRKIRPRFSVPSEEGFRRLLDHLFLQREHPLGDALRRLGPAAEPVIEVLPATLLQRKVSHLTPEDFGQVAHRVDAAGLPVPAVPDELKRKAQKYF